MPANSTDWAIDVQNLTKSFAGTKAVNGISLKVKKGEIFGFLGANGSGKTTTIRMICGLLKPTSGSGTCLGYDIIKDASKIKDQVGYMTQKFSLYEDLSAWENIDFIARVYNIPDRKKRIQEAFELFEFPKSNQSKLAGALSGGWKQRLALTSVCLTQPKLLLLDEPTAGVDPKARRDFWDHINSVANTGVTCLVTTHYMDEAERCQRLAYISFGRVLLEGTQDDLINQSKLVTFLLKGNNLHDIVDELRKLPAVEQVAAFGPNLHVSGHNKKELEAQLQPFKTQDTELHSIEPSLEDVFIHSIEDKPQTDPNTQ